MSAAIQKHSISLLAPTLLEAVVLCLCLPLQLWGALPLCSLLEPPSTTLQTLNCLPCYFCLCLRCPVSCQYTSQCIDFRPTRSPYDNPLEAFPSHGYRSSGLAVHETDVQFTILIGEISKTDSSTIRLITIHSCSLVNSLMYRLDNQRFKQPRIIVKPG